MAASQSAGRSHDAGGGILSIMMIGSVTMIGMVSALGAVTMVALRRRYVVVTVVGASMLPTLRPGDRVLASRTRSARVRTGQMVVLGERRPSRAQPAGLTVKRVAARAGEPVPPGLAGASALTATRVPAGRILVLGDNREASMDSRQCGFLDANQIQWVVLRTL